MHIRSLQILALFFLPFSYIHGKEKPLDKCIVRVKLKNSNIGFSIYQSDVGIAASYYKMANEYINKEYILDDIFKHKIAMFFGKKPNKEENEMITKQADKQIELQINNILTQCDGDQEIFLKQIDCHSLEEYKNKTKKTQIENFMYQQFIENNINKKEYFSIDEIEEYYKKKKENGTLKKIPEKIEVWEIKIKGHNHEKAKEVKNFLEKNKWDLTAIKKGIKGGIKIGEIEDIYDNEKSIFQQNVREKIQEMQENEISDIIKTTKGLFIIKKIQENGIRNFCCQYIFIPDKKEEEYKKDIFEFWDLLLKEIKKQDNIRNTLVQLSIYIKKKPKRSEEMLNNFEVTITKIEDRKKIESKKKMFTNINEGEFTNLFPVDNEGYYACYFLAKRVKEHTENLDDDFNSIKNQLKNHWEEKEVDNLIKSCAKNCEITYDKGVEYTKVLEKYL